MWEPNAIEAGLIATLVTLLGILITNQSKVSEFRQKWIDELREDAATLIAHSLVIRSAHPWDDVDESFVHVYQTTAKIQLRLNPKESNSVAAIAAMNEMRDANHNTNITFDEFNLRINAFTNAIQVILKNEWKRVKFGEPLYRTIFIFVIVLAGVLLVCVAFQHHPLANLLDGLKGVAKQLTHSHQ